MSHPLVQQLELQAHPEGGYYRETYRSSELVNTQMHARSAVTAIYYLLEQGQHSAWHRVSSDEIWHFYQGDDLELICMSPDLSDIQHMRLGADQERHAVIPAHYWQAARPLGNYSLMGCTVSPGFEFADFLLLREHPIRTKLAEDWQALL